jgi:hypothetical protein
MATAYRETQRWYTPIRWIDDLVKVAGSRWMRAAQDPSSWRALREAFVQQWTFLG